MTETTTPQTDSAEYLVEDTRPFSQSLIWQLQRQYYDRHGINAWGENRIPFNITTSPYIAGAYARIVFGFLRDWQAQLDLSEPVYIIEIGAGSGRLGFNFLKQLSEFFDDSVLKRIPLKYVLTDLVLKNVEYWEKHPTLKPFVETGQLDFAQFDAVNDTRIQLRRSGKTLAAGTLKNPLILLANYILDSLPQDLFSIENGQLYAVHTGLYSSQPEPDLLDPDIIGRLEIVYDRMPVSEDYYHDADTAPILKQYRETMGSTILTFPYQALACIRALQRFSGGHMLLLSGDKGEHRAEEMMHQSIPPITLHDNGFSMMFNYHALVQYFLNQGGTVLSVPYRHASLDILAFVSGAPSTTETRQAYRDFIEYNNPDDHFSAMLGFDRKEGVTLVEILAYLRMKRYDTHAFVLIYPMLMKKMNAIPEVLVPELKQMVYRVWNYYYHLGEKFNVPFYLGVVLSGLRFYEESLLFYQRAIDLYGEQATILFNMAMSLFNLERYDEALTWIEKVVAAHPDRQEVLELKAKIVDASA